MYSTNSFNQVIFVKWHGNIMLWKDNKPFILKSKPVQYSSGACKSVCVGYPY